MHEVEERYLHQMAELVGVSIEKKTCLKYVSV